MNWKSIIATALVTGVVTIVTGMALFWWQSEKSELIYNSIQSIPFDDASNSLFIQQIEITNSGDKTVEDVVLSISFTDEVIEKSRVVIDKAISHKKEGDEHSITLKIDNLNPDEGANVSVLYKSDTPRSSGAAISLRGKGVSGKLIGSKNASNKAPIWIALIAAYAGIFAFVISTKTGRESLPLVAMALLRGRPIGGAQKHEIASALSMYGYPDKAKEYLNSSASRQYWVEADLLAAEALHGNKKLKNDTIEILILISNIPNIHKTSKAIALYNIARIYASLENEENHKSEYLNLAKKLNEQVINDRLSRDPVFLSADKSNNMLHAEDPTVAPVS